MPFEEWIYGTPPEEVDFVRINGNRVIRVEIAKDGRPLQIFTKDVVSPMLISDGTPVLAQAENAHRPRGRRRDRSQQARSRPRRRACAIPARSCPTDNRNTGVDAAGAVPQAASG